MTLKKNKQKGFTMLELLIALTLGLIVTAAAVQLILGSFITTKLQEANSQIQDSGLFGLDYIIKDIQMLNFGNSNQYEMKSNTPRGGVVLTAGNDQSNLNAALTGSITNAEVVSQSAGVSNMAEIESDQLTIQFVAPANIFNCEGVSVRAGDLIVQRYYLRESNQELSLVCDANTPTPATIIEQKTNADGSIEPIEKDNPVQSAPTAISGLGAQAQVIIPKVDQFKVLLGGVSPGGNLAYYDIETFKDKENFKIVALKLSVLIRADGVVPGGNIDAGQTFDLFGTEIDGLSGTLSDTTAANKVPRQLYIATVALRNGLGVNND
ncbi:prepilin-type N-terminal cleavage/methylation domain-containing protein [Acinetobacter cumulans]|uniref:Prepilin-type N-terminal cleavage/methylation domain-containing protein n=1 Tax=Acinetobacter cumulans TaxID=2136182 RepID=A0ABX9U854_9GAMM|nr:prepilin-type N-terminal cleavage/methylation domain-containing protein [Acinetobacter cumulans]RLL48648.1 prepilin-type N-terminal cleavage/methylation domain-containing protein [Acinetobacter cumulans]